MFTDSEVTQSGVLEEPSNPHDRKQTWRSMWISDLHAGTVAFHAEELLDFLKNNTAENLYLVGDILDIWAMKAGLYWPTSHNTVVQKLLAVHLQPSPQTPGTQQPAVQFQDMLQRATTSPLAQHL